MEKEAVRLNKRLGQSKRGRKNTARSTPGCSKSQSEVNLEKCNQLAKKHTVSYEKVSSTIAKKTLKW